MPQRFTSLLAFADFVKAGGLHEPVEAALRAEARHAGQAVIEEIHRVIGTYEYGWTPLKPETVARKRRGDTPLLETGALKASYVFRIFKVRNGYRVRIASTLPEIAFAHEYGTARIPPRPLMTPAVRHVAAQTGARLGPAAAHALTGHARPAAE